MPSGSGKGLRGGGTGGSQLGTAGRSQLRSAMGVRQRPSWPQGQDKTQNALCFKSILRFSSLVRMLLIRVVEDSPF